MSERNPIPACLSHLEQMRPKPASRTALHYLINDLRQYAKALDRESQSIIAEDAAETMTRAADHLEASNPTALKFCRDCKWCRYPGVAVSVCTHDKALEPAVNVVSGEPGQSPLYCVNMRMAVGAPCGIEARLFEARESK